MKKILTSIILLFVPLSLAQADSTRSQTNDVSFEGIQQSYSVGRKMHFRLTNASAETVVFYCTVERKKTNGWQEMAYAITSEDEKAVRLYPLNSGETKSFVWFPHQYAAIRRLGPGTYRLKAEVKYKDRATPGRSSTVVSREFELLK